MEETDKYIPEELSGQSVQNDEDLGAAYMRQILEREPSTLDDAGRGPLTEEELSGFKRRGLPKVPNVMPYVRFRPIRNKPAMEVGIKVRF